MANPAGLRPAGSWSCCRLRGQSVLTSVTAAGAEDSSTMALLAAYAATRIDTPKLAIKPWSGCHAAFLTAG
jgi:hypothetical protein